VRRHGEVQRERMRARENRLAGGRD
jgi:hypothetical protein